MELGGRYHVFGMALQSALPLPEAVPDDDPAVLPDVTVRLGEAPCPPGLAAVARGAAAGPTAFWLDVPGVARLLVRGGSEVVVEPRPGAAAEHVRPYLLGSGMGALLHQRGVLPLHASAVALGGRAVAFAGASGAGKSTLAMALAARGHVVLSDDVAGVDWQKDGPVVRPGLRGLKLWRASLETGGHGTAALARVLPDMDKFLLPVSVAASPLPLAAVVLLKRGDARLDRMAGAAAMAALVAQTFRGVLVPAMGRDGAHFAQCRDLARRPGVWRLARPWRLDQLDDAITLVEQAFGGSSDGIGGRTTSL